MKIPAFPFTVTDWSKMAPTTHAGETGQALWRTLNIGDLRVRMVEYTPGYLADDWREDIYCGLRGATPSLRANGSRECAPDDRLREAIHLTAQRKDGLLRRFAMTARRMCKPRYPGNGSALLLTVERGKNVAACRLSG